MSAINIHEAKTHLSRIVDEVASGKEVLIAKAGKPMARLLPLSAKRAPIRFGVLKGKVKIAADFDAPLPEEVLRGFEGG
jgi:prevent-host-death family protein